MRAKGWILNNLGFKMVAFLVALVLWFGVKTERVAEVRYPVPLDVVPESDDEAILTPLPATVEVVFSGAGKDLLRLGDQNYRVRKILPTGKPGPRRLILDVADVSGSGNLSVEPVAIDPNVLTLAVDRVASKRVPLRPLAERAGGEAPLAVRFEPPVVTLIGARSILAGIDTVAVDLRRFRGRPDEPRTISVSIPQHPTVIVQPDSIVVLPVEQEVERKATGGVPGEPS